MGSIDLNCDLGESYGVWRLGDDEAMLPLVSSANVACGFHGGDPGTLRRTCRSAVEHRVVIGAQVSYPDLAGFGRREMALEPDEIRDAVLYQIGALDAFARTAGAVVAYVKPHGALYHVVSRDRAAAVAVVEAASEFGESLAILGAPGSELVSVAAEAGLRAVREAFADRGYRADGSLVPRSEPGALLEDPETVADRVVRIATGAPVPTVHGSSITIEADSVCIHGDTAGAVDMGRAIRRALDLAGVDVVPFVQA